MAHMTPHIGALLEAVSRCACGVLHAMCPFTPYCGKCGMRKPLGSWCGMLVGAYVNVYSVLCEVLGRC